MVGKEFSVNLQGKISHEAILLRQDAELRLLDLMKRCLMSKVKCDREYGIALSAVASQGLKIDKSDDLCGSLITNAWKTMMEGLDSTGKLIRQNTENLELKISDSLINLYTEKKKIRKFYHEECMKTQQLLTNMSEEVNRKKMEYKKYLELYKLTRAKFEERYVKSGRGGRKLDDVREKYQKVCRKLHLTHNEYVLLLCESSQFEKDFRNVLLPDLLERQQNLQETTILIWKQLLQDITRISDLTSQKFKNIQNRIEIDQAAIKENEEYAEFAEKFKTAPIEQLKFVFDASLIEDAAVKFSPDELTVDNLTIDWLRKKLGDLEENIRKTEEKRTSLAFTCPDLPLLNETSSNSQETSCRISMLEVQTKGEIEELKCSERKMSKQVDLIRSALNEHGCEEVPSGCDFSLDNQSFHNDSHEQVSSIGNNSPIEEEWFHGVLPREEVVRLLVNDGDFLIRETIRNDESQTVLSACWGGHKHFIVQTTPDGKHRFEGPSFPSIPELISYQYTSGLPVTGRSGAILMKPIPRERWELNNNDVVLLDKIGRGNFGDVYKAQLKNKNEVYAVKTCRGTLPDDQKKRFLQEGRILKQYDHPNIVKLIGICVQKQPIMIVMELVPGGSLLIFLRKQASNLNDGQLMKMCLDVAAGMRYLESKNCIHRDLAARNCLIGCNDTVKISDFGMSREEEEYIVSDGMKQIPIKWTAPEALNFGKYTSLCDVWSYGILCWEIFSKGSSPYSGMSNAKARERIDAGYRMPAPESTPEEMFRLMLRCWEYKPEDRPNFEQLYTVVDTLCTTYGLSIS